jgi:hypothetical protein
MITKTCLLSGQEFTITDEDLAFYEKMDVPTPTLCPEERLRRRLARRNERNLYRRKCDATEKNIISVYTPDTPFPVYDNKYWWSDAWDPLSYEQDFDFSRPFFEQFDEMRKKIPRINIMLSHCENCDWSPYGVYSKDCYLSVSSNWSEEVHYCFQTNHSNTCLDCALSQKLELCYETINCKNCFELMFSQFCENCSDSWFLKNCIGCKNCFGCVNLKNKEFYFLNEKCSRETYFEKLKNLGLHKHSNLKNMRAHFAEFTKKNSHRFMFGRNNEDSSGDNLFDSKNAHHCFDAANLEDCAYVSQCPTKAKDCHDANYMPGSELIFEVLSGVNNYNSKCNLYAWDIKDSDYNEECFFSNDLFGCVGLKHQEFCIFNKKYTPEEYYKLRNKIITHMQRPVPDGTGKIEWGEFFPIEMSPFAYNETIAQGYLPLTKTEALKRGYKWRDEEDTDRGAQPEHPYEIPDDINDINDSILDEILYCETTHKPFKIQKSELDFYRKVNLPIPRFHPDERHKQRMALRNPQKLYSRLCGECKKDIQTTYAPDRPEKIFCEKCYYEVVN